MLRSATYAGHVVFACTLVRRALARVPQPVSLAHAVFLAVLSTTSANVLMHFVTGAPLVMLGHPVKFMLAPGLVICLLWLSPLYRLYEIWPVRFAIVALQSLFKADATLDILVATHTSHGGSPITVVLLTGLCCVSSFLILFAASVVRAAISGVPLNRSSTDSVFSSTQFRTALVLAAMVYFAEHVALLARPQLRGLAAALFLAEYSLTENLLAGHVEPAPAAAAAVTAPVSPRATAKPKRS